MTNSQDIHQGHTPWSLRGRNFRGEVRFLSGGIAIAGHWHWPLALALPFQLGFPHGWAIAGYPRKSNAGTAKLRSVTWVSLTTVTWVTTSFQNCISVRAIRGFSIANVRVVRRNVRVSDNIRINNCRHFLLVFDGLIWRIAVISACVPLPSVHGVPRLTCPAVVNSPYSSWRT